MKGILRTAKLRRTFRVVSAAIVAAAVTTVFLVVVPSTVSPTFNGQEAATWGIDHAKDPQIASNRMHVVCQPGALGRRPSSVLSVERNIQPRWRPTDWSPARDLDGVGCAGPRLGPQEPHLGYLDIARQHEHEQCSAGCTGRPDRL